MNSIIDDIELGIEFVSADMDDGEAFLSRTTGEVYYRSDYVDEDQPLPADLDDETKYLPLPHKRELDLGVVLVFQFAEKRLPNKAGEVHAMFKKRGAYSRFSDWLDRHNLVDDWHRYKDQKTKQAIKTWCKENGIKL